MVFERVLAILLLVAPPAMLDRAGVSQTHHYNRLDKGGHFAAWEQPEIFVNELRESFKSLR